MFKILLLSLLISSLFVVAVTASNPMSHWTLLTFTGSVGAEVTVEAAWENTSSVLYIYRKIQDHSGTAGSLFVSRSDFTIVSANAGVTDVSTSTHTVSQVFVTEGGNRKMQIPLLWPEDGTAKVFIAASQDFRVDSTILRGDVTVTRDDGVSPFIDDFRGVGASTTGIQAGTGGAFNVHVERGMEGILFSDASVAAHAGGIRITPPDGVPLDCPGYPTHCLHSRIPFSGTAGDWSVVRSPGASVSVEGPVKLMFADVEPW